MIILRKETLPATGVVLYPTDEESEAHLRKMKDGQNVAVEAKRARSPKHHRKFFAVLNKIFDHQEQFKSVDNLLDAVKLEIGYSDLKEKLNGDQWHEPKSISFHDMGQDEFNEFYDRALDVLCLHFKIDPAMLEQEFSEATTSGEEPESPTPESGDEQDADPAGSTENAEDGPPASEQEPSSTPPLGDGSAAAEDAPETPAEKSGPDTTENPETTAQDMETKQAVEKKPSANYSSAAEMIDVLDTCQTPVAVDNSIKRMKLDDLFPPDKAEVLEAAEKRKAELAK